MGSPITKPIVWVTGGAGYIGSSVVRELKRNGYLPVVIDNFSTGSRRMVPRGVPVVEADIEDRAELFRELLDWHHPAAVIHLAAKTSVGWCESNPAEAFKTNVIGTHNIASVAEGAGALKFVFASSAAVYGDLKGKKAHPKMTGLKPVGVYGKTKLTAEEMLLECFSRKQMRLAILRYFNVAGASCSTEYYLAPKGRPDPGARAIITTLTRAQVAGERASLHYHPMWYGKRFPIRDFIHVQDVATYTAAAASTSHIHGTTVNVARGVATPINWLLDLASKELRSRVECVPITNSNEIFYSVSDTSPVKPKYNLAAMWASELRWQKSKLYKQIQGDLKK